MPGSIGPCRADIEALARDPAACEMEMVMAAVARLDHAEAGARLLARGLRGLPIPITAVARVYPYLLGPAISSALAILAEGDRGAALIQLAEEDAFPEDQTGVFLHAMALYSAWRLDGAALQARIRREAMLLAYRNRADPDFGVAAAVLHAFAAEAGDRRLREMVPRAVEGAPLDLVFLRQLLAEPRDRMLRMIVDNLDPDLPMGRAYTDDLVTRLKVGRNEPCPCGSGKKFKRCHALEGATGTSRRPAVSPAKRSVAAFTPLDVQTIPLPELARSRLERLSDEALLAALDRLLKYRAWDLAERAMLELGARPSIPQVKRDAFRLEVLRRAVAGRRFEFARRLAAQMRAPEIAFFSHVIDLRIALSTGAPDALDKLGRVSELALRDESGKIAINLANTLLPVLPGLGILLARGCLHVDRVWEAERVLQDAEMVRALLDLPPGDPAWDILAALQDAGSQGEESAKQLMAVNESDAHAPSEADHLRDQLREASHRARQMEQRVRELEDSLADASRAVVAAVASAPGREADPSQVRALRGRIDELKLLIRERNQERASLRRQLADALRSPVSPRRDQPVAGSAGEPDDDDGEPIDAPSRPVLIPTWDRRAESGMRGVPAHVAAEALRTVAALAGGDPAAWRAVKRPKGMGWPVLMTRVGIHHRLLFKTDDERLGVLEIVSRAALDLTLKRLRTP